MDRRQAVMTWVLGSAALMVLGAFGPWVKAFGMSASGTDGSNDGWLVVGAAVIGGGLFALARNSKRLSGLVAILGGVLGVAVTLYDRHHVQSVIQDGGALVQGLVQIGWGLNLALAASVSLAVAGIVSQTSVRAR
jgi:hypothetical protein